MTKYLQQVEKAQPLGYLQLVTHRSKENSFKVTCFPSAENNYYIW